MSDTPWRSATLADLVDDAIGGLWGSPPDSGKRDETDVLVIRGADFRNWNARRALDAAPRRVPARSLEKRRLEAGDIVLEVSGGSPAQPVGRVLVIDADTVSRSSMPLICSNFCRRLRLKPGVDPYFIKRQLDWIYHAGYTDRFQTSTTNIRNLQVGDFLAGTELVVPEEELQVELSALLDSIEEKVTTSSTHVASARQVVDRFRQAVLVSACSGRLSAEWRDANPDALVTTRMEDLLEERHRQWQVAAAGGTSRRRYKEPMPPAEVGLAVQESWRIGSLSQVAHLDVGHAFKSAEFEESGIRLLRGENTGPRRLKWHEVKYWPESRVHEFEHLIVREHDLILGMDRPIVAAGLKLARAMPGDVPCLLVQRVLRIRAVQPAASAFIELCLRDGRFERFLAHDGMTGTDLPHITGDGVARFPIPMVPFDEQDEIIRRVDQLLKLADTVEERIDLASRRIERSSQAVLAKVFRGELAPAGANSR